jgi:hypothetical protein
MSHAKAALGCVGHLGHGTSAGIDDWAELEEDVHHSQVVRVRDIDVVRCELGCIVRSLIPQRIELGGDHRGRCDAGKGFRPDR